MIKRFALALIVAAGIAPTLAGTASAAEPEGCGAWNGGLRVCLELKGGQLVATAFAKGDAPKDAKIQICRAGQSQCTRMVNGLKTAGWPDKRHTGNFLAVVSSEKLKVSAKSQLLLIPGTTPA